jgi:antitoxin (DNA-binding transcriptional repressor) of toxin-antitoxin stability system
MNQTISAKNLRLHLKEILLQAARGHKFTVIYNSEPVAEITPVSTSKYEDKKKVEKNTEVSEFMKAVYAATGIGTATDVTTPDKDKEILRKRLIEKHVK